MYTWGMMVRGRVIKQESFINVFSKNEMKTVFNKVLLLTN